MARHIVIIQGHPDSTRQHFGHALADAYAKGAEAAGHEVERLEVAALDLPPLHSRAEWEAEPPPRVKAAQDAIRRADHIVILYPMWLGTMPALLKAFLEQVMRPGFAVPADNPSPWARLLAGRSARIVVTMGMPGFFYRWFFRAHSLKNLERNILKLVGIKPVRASVVGMVESPKAAGRERWLKRMDALGRAAA